MADRKEVAQGLQGINTYLKSKAIEASAEKNDTVRECLIESQTIINDAIALLKEQEPIQMKISEDYGLIKFGECPKCKSFINNRYFPKSCGCGQAVKWYD